MIGAEIHDGDVVFIRSQPVVDDGQQPVGSTTTPR